jgi:protein-tyrosine phosphatase
MELQSVIPLQQNSCSGGGGDFFCDNEKVVCMVDFHTHILPGIDDGSRDIESSLEMLRMETQQGVTSLVATPHFYAHKDSFTHFLERRENAYRHMLDGMQKAGLEMEIRVGAEVYYFPGIGRAEQLPRLCIGETPVLLLELPFAQWTDNIYQDVSQIIKKQKLRVVLAHVERYYDFQKKKDIWNKMFELPLYPQINAGSFADRRRRRFGLGFLQEQIDEGAGGILLGSDCHNTTSRPPNLPDGRKVIEKKLGSRALECIDDLEKRIWEDD